MVITTSDVEFYDFSSHLVYLKNDRTVLKEADQGQFAVYARGREIYAGTILSGYSSYLPKGPVIYTKPTFYNEYLLSIDFINPNDFIGPNVPGTSDPRSDPRIMDALRQAGQYRQGLACEVVSVQVAGSGKVTLELRLTNRDEEDLYHLDPDKMGTALFHYFTNGLSFRGTHQKPYTHHLAVEKPEPWNGWKREWLSVLKSKESRLITLTYDAFDAVPAGKYNADFTFPGLTYQVAKKDVWQGKSSRIWLGKTRAQKDVEVP
ncbi:hypothetical protein GCM10027275_32750 [Rhabdobacter roseus]